MLCDDLEGWDGIGGGRKVKREGSYVYVWLIHWVVCKKLTL